MYQFGWFIVLLSCAICSTHAQTDTAEGAPLCEAYKDGPDFDNGDFIYQRAHFVTTAADRVYVTDRYNNTIFLYKKNASETPFDSINIDGFRDGGFDEPSGVQIVGGKIFIADIGPNRIVELEKDSSNQWVVLNTFGNSTNGPHDIALGTTNDLYVTDTKNNRMVVFATDGTFLRQFSLDDEDPTTCAFDTNKQLYVTHKALGMVFVHDIYGSAETRKVLIGEGVKPKQLNIDKDDRILIATSEKTAAGVEYGAVRIYDDLNLLSGNKFCIIKNLVPKNGDPESAEAYGVDIDPTDGRVWITDGPRFEDTKQGGHVYTYLCKGDSCSYNWGERVTFAPLLLLLSAVASVGFNLLR